MEQNKDIIPIEQLISDIKLNFTNKDFRKVEMICKFILKHDDKNPEAHYYLGLIAKQVDKDDLAIKHVSTAIRLKEKNIAIWYMDLGNIYYKKEEYEEALKLYSRALQLSPSLEGHLYNNIGAIYKKKNEFDKAIEYYNKAITIYPDNPIMYSNLALAVKEKGDPELAIKICKKALEIDPNSAAVFYNWGLILRDQNKPDEAISLFKKVIELDQGHPDAHRDLSIALLVTKDFEAGWAAYENRYAGLIEPRPKAEIPKWRGESLEGKSIYVLNEQGCGDSIQFVRYLPLLNKLGANVVFQPQSSLQNIFKENDLKAQIVDETFDDKTVGFDYYSLLLSAPYLLKANADNIPFSEGYLKANPEKVNAYKKYFNTDKFKVGIFWQGSPTFKNDKNRSVKLEQFYPLGKIPNVQLYSLQKGVGIEQLKDAPEDFNIINLGETFEDFSDTAAAIENLDLVISVDSAVAHLTGSLNKPVWLVSFYVWEWRWFKGTDETPWYKSMKIYHQDMPKIWDSTFERISDDLLKLTSKNI